MTLRGKVTLMRILVMGGTWFLGKAIVEEALRRGWDVTAFNRGRSDAVDGVETVQGDRTSPDDLKRLATYGPWDAVIDTSSSEFPPRDVLLAAETLRLAASRWVHVSTVSVYQGWPHHPLTEDSPLLECPPDDDGAFGHTGSDGSPTKYGFQKAGGEAAVRAAFGEDAIFLRPGVILGPGEYVGRLPWWLARAERGGSVLVPAPAEQMIQPVDLRDVAAFAVDQAASDLSGRAFNVAHPEGISWGEFMGSCLDVTQSAGRPVWADAATLVEHGVKQWTELPLWRTHAGVWSVDATRAVGAGLRCRPFVETIADTWAWMQSGGRPVEHPRWAEHGLAPEKEARVLSAIGDA
ncbi:NAD-dependent epimerase/dehydratase family protein [Streptomyces sp. H27-C3]|uniref:NAD-dependent epimerase/dehydratase family protein n=1 Tax=Streptomyces sp. H27-C3 TaxID=3046305 RepID=UPI0024BB15A3|nr:NAD-dependent epimerase/dehydratase family protein [Streptomyces sp. H27-C3]MDJ0466636.1 NAD-dependent epimerase/dehydratase family protein [Streptomyces sp. H27-C3]